MAFTQAATARASGRSPGQRERETGPQRAEGGG